jgi:hypothetical protein
MTVFTFGLCSDLNGVGAISVKSAMLTTDNLTIETSRAERGCKVKAMPDVLNGTAIP